MSQDRDLLGQGILYIFRLLFVTIFLLSLIQKRMCVCLYELYDCPLCRTCLFSFFYAANQFHRRSFFKLRMFVELHDLF